jgi:2-iminobutanoate/2-iminopropanoate deaminase
MKTAVASPHGPKAAGPYSQGIISGDLVFLSGQIPLDPDTGKIVRGEMREQVRQVLKNVRVQLEAAGCGMADIVKTTVFLVDLADFGLMNELYAEAFAGTIPPARATVQVSALPLGSRIEIEVIARRSS